MSEPEAKFKPLADVLDLLADPKVGVIPFVCEQHREAGAPEYFYFAAQACRTDAFGPFRNFRSTGGAALDRGTALARAVGEAIERYCCAIVDLNEYPICAAKNAEFTCADPASFALYGESQYRSSDFLFVPFNDDTPVRWVPAIDLKNGEETWLPAAMVFVPYKYFRNEGDHPIFQPNSTGLSCHMTYTQAAIGAICEAVERDSFSIAWQAMLNPPKLDAVTLDAANRERIARFQRIGSEVSIFDITTDLEIPVFLAVQRHAEKGIPPLTFAAAAELDPREAISKALDELAHTMRYMAHILHREPRIPAAPTFLNIVDQESHLNFWCSHERAELASFLFTGNKVVAFDELPNLRRDSAPEDLRVLVDLLNRRGHRCYVADLTTSDMEELGFAVVRAVIPGLHPLFWNHHYRGLGGQRLWMIPQKLGYRGVSPQSGDNPIPHPYP